MAKRICTVDGCVRIEKARGVCQPHYDRLRRYGDPLAGPPIRIHGDLAARFWQKVDKRGPDECWEWTGARQPKGYGLLGVDGESRLAHRVAYELLVGPIPEGLQLDHLCRNRGCVNAIRHLEPVTGAENQRRGLNGILKTHCPYGHPYTPENTGISHREGWTGRYCRTCHRNSGKRYYAKTKAAATETDD